MPMNHDNGNDGLPAGELVGVRRLAERLEGVVDQVQGALEDVKPSDALFAIADELTAINQQLAALEQRLERLLPGENLKCDGCGSEYFVARCPKCGDGNAS